MFKERLAVLLEVPSASNIWLTVEAASVRVTAKVITQSESDAQAADAETEGAGVGGEAGFEEEDVRRLAIDWAIEHVVSK